MTVDASGAADACKLAKLAELPVSMVQMRPVISAKINGAEARFIVDSGAFYSTMSGPAARRFRIAMSVKPLSYAVVGVGGTTELSLGMVKNFDMASIPIHDITFLVGGSEFGADGVLGQNVLGVGDVEYDLAHGVVRIMRPDNGCVNSNLAYWVPSGGAYSVMPISYPTRTDPHTTGAAYLNGVKIHVTFDTGAGQSILSLKAAERAGIKPDSPGVTAIGYGYGVGSSATLTYLASFPSFKIGDEEIDRARLRFGDVGIDTDMLIGADFFLSHHVYVSNKQHQLYFTYNGGPVFDLRARPAPESTIADSVTADRPAVAAPAIASDAPPEQKAPSAEQQAPSPAELAKAAERSRQGLSLFARRDYAGALANLNQACELVPDPEYLIQRGAIHEAMNQPASALADFNKALALHPNYGNALLARANFLARTGDKAEAAKDLDDLSRHMSAADDTHLLVADRYFTIDRWDAALAHYNAWIAAHPDDGRALPARVGRCASRTYLHADLPAAVKDCSQALKLYPKNDPQMAVTYAYRGLAYLEQSDYPRAIADYDTALRIHANDADALYGRGTAELRTNKPDAGNADLAAAVAQDPNIRERFKRYGISPDS